MVASDGAYEHSAQSATQRSPPATVLQPTGFGVGVPEASTPEQEAQMSPSLRTTPPVGEVHSGPSTRCCGQSEYVAPPAPLPSGLGGRAALPQAAAMKRAKIPRFI